MKKSPHRPTMHQIYESSKSIVVIMSNFVTIGRKGNFQLCSTNMKDAESEEEIVASTQRGKNYNTEDWKIKIRRRKSQILP